MIRLAWLGLLFVVLCSTSLGSFSIKTGKIQITSLTRQDFLLPGVMVLLESTDYRREVMLELNDYVDPKNLIEVPVGIYSISSMNSGSWYYPFKRARFLVKESETIRINVLPEIRILMQSLLIKDGELVDEYDYADEPKYDTITIPKSPHKLLKVQIRYKKKKGRKKLRYKSATLSFDNWLIDADQIILNKKDLIIEATGGVIVEDGRTRDHCNQARFMIVNGAIKREP